MPWVRKMSDDCWEIRSKLDDGTIARLFFTLENNQMILLHAIIKKSQKTPPKELALALSRKNQCLKKDST